MSKIKNIIPQSIYSKLLNMYNAIFTDYSQKIYSQEGEELILRKLFNQNERGFYIDIGAHHPKRFSNTYYFYKNGWCGINIEARPESKKLFDRVRPFDINLEQAIASEEKELIYYMFNEPALNGFSLPNVLRLKDHATYKVINEIKLHTQRLDKLLEIHLKPDQIINFMSIDVEGLDYDVIISNDWERFKPLIVLVEDSKFDFKSGSIISDFLESYNYRIFARTFNTSFFKLIKHNI